MASFGLAWFALSSLLCAADALQELNPKKTALLVVDMQNDFCHADGMCAIFRIQIYM